MNNAITYILESPEIPSSLLTEIKNNNTNTVIPLNHKLEKFLRDNNVRMISEEEILECSDFALIDKLTLKLSTKWYNEKTDEQIDYHNVNVTKVLRNELYQIFLRMVHRIILLQKLIKKINPKIIKMTNFDTVLNEISVEIFNSRKIKIEVLDMETNNVEIKSRFDKVNFSIRIFGKNKEFYLSKRTFSYIKYFYEKYWDLRYVLEKGTKHNYKHNEKTFLLLDFNLTLHTSFIQYLSDKKYNLLLMNNRRPLIWNEKSLEISKELVFEKIKPIRYKFSQKDELFSNFSKLIEKNFLYEEFNFSGIELGKYFLNMILYILEKRLPEIISKIDQIEKVITNKKIDGVWTLDDFGEDRIFVNVFQNHNIPVLAFLAGNLTYQKQDNIDFVEPFALDRTADKLLVWGQNDYKNCRETDVDLEKIESGGAPRYEKFNQISSTDNDYILVLVGAFPSTAHSIFLSTSFITKFENRINQVFLELKKFNKKIILKRHPTQGINEIIDYEKILLKIIPNSIVLKEADTIQLISKSSMIITTPSTVVEESILLNKPIILLPYLNNNDRIPYTTSGAVIEINNLENIYQKIHDCLYNENIKLELKIGREKFVKEVFSYSNSASEKHNEIMLKLISEKN